MKNSNLRTGRCFVGALLIFTLAVSACGDEGSSASPLSVKMLYTYTGKGDRSYNDLAYEGLFRAMQAVTFEKLEMVPADHDQAGEILSSWLAAEASAPDLIIVISSSYADIMTRRDWDLNGHRMLYLDYSAPPRDGLSSVTYRTFAPSFIGGVSAARVSVTGTCSALGGMPDPVVDEFIEGFRQGVEHLSGDFLGPFYLADDESGFSQSGPARELALELREESGVDVIFPVAGGSGLGVIEAAKETDQTLFALGVDVDQSYLGPGVIIGSVVKRIDRIILETITEAAAGRFSPGHQVLGMDTGDTEFVVNSQFAAALGDICADYREAALAAETAYLGSGS